MKTTPAESLLGAKVAHYRSLQGMTQEELAEKAGITKTYVSHIETGRKWPTFRTTVKIAKALNIDWKELTESPLIKRIKSLSIPETTKEKLLSTVSDVSGML